MVQLASIFVQNLKREIRLFFYHISCRWHLHDYIVIIYNCNLRYKTDRSHYECLMMSILCIFIGRLLTGIAFD